MSGHTPTPWTFDEHGGTFYVWGPGQAMVTDGDVDEGYVARMRGVGRGATVEEQRANAEFIVRACNAHEELLQALREIAAVDAEDPSIPQDSPYAYAMGKAKGLATCAIVRAECRR